MKFSSIIFYISKPFFIFFQTKLFTITSSTIPKRNHRYFHPIPKSNSHPKHTHTTTATKIATQPVANSPRKIIWVLERGAQMGPTLPTLYVFQPPHNTYMNETFPKTVLVQRASIANRCACVRSAERNKNYPLGCAYFVLTYLPVVTVVVRLPLFSVTCTWGCVCVHVCGGGGVVGRVLY